VRSGFRRSAFGPYEAYRPTELFNFGSVLAPNHNVTSLLNSGLYWQMERKSSFLIAFEGLSLHIFGRWKEIIQDHPSKDATNTNNENKSNNPCVHNLTLSRSREM
jgi:hypothetical protein